MNKMHDCKINLASEQVLVSGRGICRMHLKAEAGIPVKQTGDHAADKTLGYRDRCTDRQITSGGIGNRPDILDALLNLVEDRSSTLHECLAVGCRLDTIGAPVEKPDTKRLLEFSNRSRNGGL